MFIRLNQTNKKIAMGLLSFMPQHKKVKELQKTIERYEKSKKWKLYLWKEEDLIGVLGIHYEDDATVTIQDICVNPSYRNQGIGRKMVQELEKKFVAKGISVRTTEDTNKFIEKCHCSK